MKKTLFSGIVGISLLTLAGCGAATNNTATNTTANKTTTGNISPASSSDSINGQFATPKVAPPTWMKLITVNDVKELSFAKSPAIGQPDKQTNSRISALVETLQRGSFFDAGNVVFPGSTWQITIWLRNGQAIGITPILRGEILNQPPHAHGPGPGPANYPPKHNQYAVVYLQKPSTITNGANLMKDKYGRGQVVFFDDPSLSIQKIVSQLTKR